jgi:hypothetical protein
MTDVRKALEAEREMEHQFVEEAIKSESAPKGWPAALNLFHICMWRERMSNALTDVREGRAYNPPPGDVDEANDAELPGGLGVALADIAERSDVLLASLLKLWDELGERPFKWYTNNTTTEAILRNSYVHPRSHIVAYLKENGDRAGSERLLEDAVTDMREIDAPPVVLGFALYNLAGTRVAQDRLDDALELLIEAFPMRPDLQAAAAKDVDLEPLYDNPAFKALVKA